MASPLDMTSQELHTIVSALDQALYNHQQWYNLMIRGLICRLPPDRHNILPDAHRECLFGQWYYGEAVPKQIADHMGFVALGMTHQQMHGAASQLLKTIAEGGTITPVQYDGFANILERLRLEILSLKNELETLLYHQDPLTMATNRISMLPILREQHEMTKRQNTTCCIVMVDIDNFKNLNDQHGHSVGDKVLSTVGRYLGKSIHNYDKLFRYGGEEFLICMPQTTTASCTTIIEKICKDLSNIQIDLGQGQTIQVTASFGIATIDPTITIEKSIEHADKALYEAKRSGKKCVRVFDSNIVSNI